MPRTTTMTILAATGALMLSQAPAHAGPVQLLSQHRYVSVTGTASILDFGHGELISDTGHDAYSAAAGDFGPFDAAAIVSAFGVSGYEANASGSGAAAQTSSLDGGAFGFTAATEMYAAGSSGVPGRGSVTALATTGFEVGFSIAAPSRWRLEMSSAVPDSNSQFSFRLADVAGTVIWDQTYLYDPVLGTQYDYVTLLDLAAGEYALTAYLSSYASFDGDVAYSGQGRAGFALAPLVELPEPHAAALLALGLAGLQRLRVARATPA
ncbi:hypothetical protein EV699_10759 [Plasticicumulans lactativorans]|uniref:Secreted protein with PEP-CTERM sorting signal n=2 Tax=Plasticicumulans lactativorans TaxID=1133106 RepID=A0A4R2L8M8_9GAMM|nr:hypothetical protein EV699_10759 [Plasticicumulans lactativorans]